MISAQWGGPEQSTLTDLLVDKLGERIRGMSGRSGAKAYKEKNEKRQRTKSVPVEPRAVEPAGNVVELVPQAKLVEGRKAGRPIKGARQIRVSVRIVEDVVCQTEQHTKHKVLAAGQ